MCSLSQCFSSAFCCLDNGMPGLWVIPDGAPSDRPRGSVWGLLQALDSLPVPGQGGFKGLRGVHSQPVEVGQADHHDVGDVHLDALGVAPSVHIGMRYLSQLLRQQAVPPRLRGGRSSYSLSPPHAGGGRGSHRSPMELPRDLPYCFLSFGKHLSLLSGRLSPLWARHSSQGVDTFTPVPDLVVHMRTGGEAGVARKAQDLTSFHHLSLFDVNP